MYCFGCWHQADTIQQHIAGFGFAIFATPVCENMLISLCTKFLRIFYGWAKLFILWSAPTVASYIQWRLPKVHGPSILQHIDCNMRTHVNFWWSVYTRTWKAGLRSAYFICIASASMCTYAFLCYVADRVDCRTSRETSRLEKCSNTPKILAWLDRFWGYQAS